MGVQKGLQIGESQIGESQVGSRKEDKQKINIWIIFH